MASYIYSVFRLQEALEGPSLKFTSTRKYEAKKYLERHLLQGVSASLFEVTRSRDGIADTVVDVDVYEFLDIDLGETL